MIKLENISFRYDNSKEDILKDVSFTLETTSILAVVGPSGGGKSTLLRVISGLEEPYSGRLFIDEKKVFDKGTLVSIEKRGVGMLFQDYALFPHMTVEKNIEYGLVNMKKAEKKEKVKDMLKLVDLEEYRKRYPHQLSGGQQQRVALARALAPNPKILLLDEPFSNLDSQLLEKVRSDLLKIIKKTGITTIMVTHNPEDAAAMANKTIIIDKKVSIKEE